MSRRKQHKPQALRNDEAEINLEAQRSLSIRDESIEGNGKNSDGHSANSCGDIFACTYCPACFETYSQVKMHEQEHADIMPFRCPHCLKGFKHKRSLDRHMNLHIGVKKYRCGFCQTAFFRSDHLKLHLKTHETSKYQFSCSICQRGFHSLPGLQSHAMVHNILDESIKNCANMTSRENIKIEDESETGSPLMLDSVNEEKPASPGAGTDHTCGSNHQDSTDPLPVDTSPGISGASLAKETQLNQPTFGSFLIHSTPSVGITCSVCSAVLPDVDALQSHTLQRHSLNELLAEPLMSRFSLDGSQDPVYACDQCHRNFESILALHSHVSAIHKTEQQAEMASPFSSARSNAQIYQCSQCDFSVQNLKAFTSHMRQHVHPLNGISLETQHSHSPAPYLAYFCDLCHVTFDDQTTMESHLIGHYLRKESQHSCGHCVDNRNSGGRLLFNALDDLNRHLMEFHAKVIHKCSICCDIFELQNDLHIHYVMAHCSTLSRFRCRSCNAVFPSEEQFKVHIRAAHLPVPSGKCHSVYNPNVANPFTCPLCFDAFSVEYLFDKHMEVVHKSSQGTFEPHGSIADLLNGKYAATIPSTSTNKCNICDEKFGNVADLTKHKLTRHCKVVRSEQCNICKEPVLSVEQFFKHIRAHSTPGSHSICIICKQSLSSVIEMQAHAKFHCETETSKDSEKHASSPLYCQYCRVKFESSQEVADHHSTCKGQPKIYQCIKCQKSFETENEIHQHVAFHMLNDGVDHKCHLCNRVFDSPSKLQRHLIEHSYHQSFSPQPPSTDNQLQTTGVEFHCWICNEACADSSALQAHVLTSPKHANEPRPHQCDWCDQKFFFDAELENHLIALHPPTSTSARQALVPTAKRNISPCSASVSDPSTPTAFMCALCGVAFTSASTLKSHMAQCRRKSAAAGIVASVDASVIPGPSSGSSPTMVKGKSILAELIGKNNSRFTRSELKPKLDSATCNARGPFQCPNCPKSFLSMSALQGHSHVHMNTVKAHHCDKCKKTFQTAAKLRNHQRQHSGDKPFMCHLCNRYFSRKDNLKVHLKTHCKSSSVVSLENIESAQDKTGQSSWFTVHPPSDNDLQDDLALSNFAAKTSSLDLCSIEDMPGCVKTL